MVIARCYYYSAIMLKANTAPNSDCCLKNSVLTNCHPMASGKRTDRQRGRTCCTLELSSRLDAYSAIFYTDSTLLADLIESQSRMRNVYVPVHWPPSLHCVLETPEILG